MHTPTHTDRGRPLAKTTASHNAIMSDGEEPAPAGGEENAAPARGGADGAAADAATADQQRRAGAAPQSEAAEEQPPPPSDEDAAPPRLRTRPPPAAAPRGRGAPSRGTSGRSASGAGGRGRGRGVSRQSCGPRPRDVSLDGSADGSDPWTRRAGSADPGPRPSAADAFEPVSEEEHEAQGAVVIRDSTPPQSRSSTAEVWSTAPLPRGSPRRPLLLTSAAVRARQLARLARSSTTAASGGDSESRFAEATAPSLASILATGVSAYMTASVNPAARRKQTCSAFRRPRS